MTLHILGGVSQLPSLGEGGGGSTSFYHTLSPTSSEKAKETRKGERSLCRERGEIRTVAFTNSTRRDQTQEGEGGGLSDNSNGKRRVSGPFLFLGTRE